jgi:hypothetical protein
MWRYGFVYASIGRPIKGQALGESNALDQSLSLTKVRAIAPAL